jgi:Tol biopolymer transport system component
MVAGRGATWGRRGVIVFAPSTQSALFKVSESGGQPVQVTTLDTARHETSHRFPYFLPDGDHFLFTVLPAGPEGFGIYVGSLGSRQVKKIMTAESAVTYAAPGYLLFRRGSALVAQRFDARGLQLKGEPFPLLSSPSFTDLDAEPIASASNDGRLMALENPEPDAQLAWLERGGTVRSTLALPPGPWGRAVLSPDDRYAVVPRNDDLWRVELARSLPLRLTSGNGQNNVPIWSPDGRKIAYTNSGRGREEIIIQNSDGSGEPRALPTTDDQFKTATDWTREGLVLTNIRARTGTDVLLAPYPGGGARELVASEYGDGIGRVSADGHWLAYISSEAGSRDAYVQSFPEPGHKLRVTSGGADRAWWMPKGDELCYVTLNHTRIMSVKLTRRGEDFEVGAPRTLFELPPDVVSVDMTHDGQRLLVTCSPDAAANRQLRLVLGWTGMVKR